MKRLLTLMLCAGLIFTIAGCKRKETVEAFEKRLTQQLIDAKYLSGEITGSSKMNMDSMGEQTLNINSTFQSDISSGFPKFKMDGTISLSNIMSLPLSLYVVENTWSITLLGQTQVHEITQDKQNQIKTVTEQLSANQASISRTVKETVRNEKKALEIHCDVNQINTLLKAAQNQNTSVEQLTLYYILNDNNEIEQIDVHIILTAGQRMDINLTIKPTSIGQPFEITPNT